MIYMYVNIKRFDETFSSRFLFFYYFCKWLIQNKIYQSIRSQNCFNNFILPYNKLALCNIITMLVCRSTTDDEKVLNLKLIFLITVEII